jgi:hypothetical protein
VLHQRSNPNRSHHASTEARHMRHVSHMIIPILCVWILESRSHSYVLPDSLFFMYTSFQRKRQERLSLSAGPSNWKPYKGLYLRSLSRDPRGSTIQLRIHPSRRYLEPDTLSISHQVSWSQNVQLLLARISMWPRHPCGSRHLLPPLLQPAPKNQ